MVTRRTLLSKLLRIAILAGAALFWMGVPRPPRPPGCRGPRPPTPLRERAGAAPRPDTPADSGTPPASR